MGSACSKNFKKKIKKTKELQIFRNSKNFDLEKKFEQELKDKNNIEKSAFYEVYVEMETDIVFNINEIIKNKIYYFK